MPLLNLLFGIGIFLLGMAQLERAIETLSGSALRRWLAQTLSPLGSILSGVAITAVAQSSTLVSLLVLAFAAAGSIPFVSAIAVMAGATLGTTSTGWLVALFGFKLSLEALAIPLLGAGALAAVLAGPERRLHHSGWAVVGFGLLLLGLGLMKGAVEALPELFGAGLAAAPPLPLYFLIGAVLTALIQSSTATILLSLTLLHGGLISLPQAMLVAAGANMGTSSTLLLVAIGGASIKRRLALGNLLYHAYTSLVALLLWWPLRTLLTAVDPLFALMAFHSLFTLAALLLFLPWLRPFSAWLEGRFREPERERVAPYLGSAAAAVPDAAVAAAERALRTLLLQVITLNARNLHLLPLAVSSEQGAALDTAFTPGTTFEQRYERIKRLEGELLNFVRLAQREKLSEKEADTLMQLTAAAREAVLSAKSLKDIRANLATLRRGGGNGISDSVATAQRGYLHPAYALLTRLVLEPHDPAYAQEQLAQLQSDNERLHETTHRDLYQSDDRQLDEETALLSTLLNVNRELWHSTDNLIQALRRFHTAA